jgi:hypothetical protein
VNRIARERERKKVNVLSKNNCDWKGSRTLRDSENSDKRKKKRLLLKAPAVPTNQILTQTSTRE